MKIEKSIVQKKRRVRRPLRPSLNIPKKACKICGKEYQPICNGQKTCSPECSHQNKLNAMTAWRAVNPDYYKKCNAYDKRKAEYIPSGKCKICGKLIIQEFISPERRAASPMHTECVLNDCLRTYKASGTITSVQVQRLRARGYTKEEFIDEYV